MTIAFCIVVLAAAAAAATDLRARRIPNIIPVALAIAGALASLRDGWAGIGTFAAIAAAVLLIGTPLFALRLLGGGDVKLLAAACATLGWDELRPFLLATLICGGLLGVAIAARAGRLSATLANVRAMALPMFSGTVPTAISGGIKMPYALAILGGALVAAACHALRVP